MIESPTQQDLGRAKNAVQDYFIRKLLIPKIYFDADWGGTKPDLVAIDRAGVGDVHVVQLVKIATEHEDDPTSLKIYADILINAQIEEIRKTPAQFRYLALVGLAPTVDSYQPSSDQTKKLLAEDGVGRIGILLVDLAESEAVVRTAVRAERFRSSRDIIANADIFVAKATPNWEVRE